ncbi:MAG TPA: putative Ig domain-containing protein, partial [Planctomycetota bacterium]|nr:putative Ig domain-containing protein [Planctomycetota bacterium]
MKTSHVRVAVWTLVTLAGLAAPNLSALDHNITFTTPAGWSDRLVISNATGATSTVDTPISTNDTVYIDFAFTNTGPDAITTPFQIHVFLNGNQVRVFTQNSLAAGQVVKIEDINLGQLAIGSPPIRVELDVPVNTNGVITETVGLGEADNVYSRNVTVTAPRPVITSSLTQIASEGVPFSYKIEATNNPTSFSTSPLPSGLTLRTLADGTYIQGTPDPSAVGSFSITLSATNANGTGSAVLSLTINARPPFITSPGSANATLGRPFSYAITALGTTPIAFTAAPLPAGLTLDGALISGTPRQGGNVKITLTANNAAGTHQRDLDLTIATPPVISSLLVKGANVGQAFSYTITASESPIAFAASLIEVDGVPQVPEIQLDQNPATANGFIINNSTGVISGTPAAGGQYVLRIRAGGTTLTRPITGLVDINGVNVTNNSVPNTRFTQELVVGDRISIGGVIRRIISITNDQALVVDTAFPMALNDLVAVSSLYGTGRLVIGVADIASTPAITSPLSAVAVESDAFAYGITATNNPTSFSAEIIAGPNLSAATPIPLGAVPDPDTGLTLNAATGVIAGVPPIDADDPMPYTIRLNATNAVGTSANVTDLTLRIDTALPRVTSARKVLHLEGAGVFQYQIKGTYTDKEQYGIINPVTGEKEIQYIAGNLPGFLTLNPTTGLIKSVGPVNIGVFVLDVQIQNNRGLGPVREVEVTINEDTGPVFKNSDDDAIVIDSAVVVAGQPFSFFLRAVNAAGYLQATPSTANRSIALNNGVPDLDLALNTNTGEISGTTLAATPPGSYFVTFFAFDSTGNTSAFRLKLQVVNSIPNNAPRFNSPLLANGTAGLEFNYDVSIAGSVVGELVPDKPNYISAFPLSLGISLQDDMLFVPSDTGLISGLPTQPGATFVSLTGVNPSGSDTVPVVITINNITITSPTTAAGQVGVPFNPYQITATGLPVQYGASGLPAGLTLNRNTGLITGTPAENITVPTTFNVLVSASNAFVTGSKTIVFTIQPKAAGSPNITNSPLAVDAFDGVPFTYNILTDMDGPPKLITSYSASGLPTGFVLDNDSTSPTFGQISGTSSQLGLYSVILSASNASGTDAKVLNLNVRAIPPTNVQPADGTVILGVLNQALNVTLSADGSVPLFYSVSSGTLPPGVTLAANVFSGTPTQAGDFPIVFTTQNAGGSVTTSITFRIRVAPAIADPGQLTAIIGDTFTYAPVVTGTTPITITFTGGIPPGITVDAPNNRITGIPNTAGQYDVIVNASNGALPDAQRTVRIVVNDMQINPPLTVSGAVGQPFSYTISATGNPTTFSFGPAGNFPPGVTQTTANTISGTPTVAGGYLLPLTVTNAGGGMATANLQIGISSVPGAPAIISNLLQTGVVGQNFSYAINATNNPTSFSATITGGPAGPSYPITLTTVADPQTGFRINGSNISGTMILPGTFVINIVATNGVGSGNANLQAAISSVTGGPAITSRLTDNATSGVPYSYQITATNAPIGLNNFAVTTALPAGLTLNADTGLISGTPMVAMATTVNIGLKVTTNIGTADATLVLNIATGAPTITSALAVNGPMGQFLSYTATATGQGPITFTFTGTLPPGLTQTAPDTVSGIPTVEGSFPVTLTATNGLGSANATVVFTIGPTRPTLTTGTLTIGKVGLAFNFPLTANGSTPITFSVTGTLPPGLTFNGAAIVGTPKESGTFSGITITATNALGNDTVNFTIVILQRDEDTDSDGFPDEFEQAFGSNPLDPNSTPFGGGKPAGELQVLNIKSMSIKLTFPPAGRDMIKVAGTFAVPDGFAPGGKDATFFVGGVLRTFSLDTRGSRKVGGDSLKIKVKGTVATFQGAFSRGTFSD